MFTFTCEPRCDESLAFPARLRASACAVAASVATGEMHPPCQAFAVNVDREALHIPYRLYYTPGVLRLALSNLEGVDKLILACLGTRHYDRYLRQECLSVLLAIEVPWLTPYIIQLAGEHVVEIAGAVADGIVLRDTSVLAAFSSENSAYLATLERRITSYWSCYHRLAYPDRNDYPGAKVLAHLRLISH